MGRTTLSKLVAVCLISSTVPSTTALTTAVTAAQVLGLLTRDSSACGDPTYTPCGKSDLPANFCCPPSTKCIPLNNATSIICCPSGQDCQYIQPITCDITQQNATTHPQNPIHNTDLSASLASCGSLCCPDGYSCQNNMCAMNKQISQSSSSASFTSTGTSTTSTAAPTSPSNVPDIATTIPSVTTTSSAVAAAVAASSQCNPFPGVAIMAGFSPGFVAGALLAILVIICLGRRRDKKRARESQDLSRISATVSDPIYDPQLACRTDFLRRESRSKYRSSRVRSLFSRQTPPAPAPQHEYPLYERQRGDGMGRSVLRTPDMKKTPSMESIRVYSPEHGAAALRPQTTFTDMMASAGFRGNEAYLGSPGRVDPRSRKIF